MDKAAMWKFICPIEAKVVVLIEGFDVHENYCRATDKENNKEERDLEDTSSENVQTSGSLHIFPKDIRRFSCFIHDND